VRALIRPQAWPMKSPRGVRWMSDWTSNIRDDFMGKCSQINRPMAVSTSLGVDKLLLVGFVGQEGISELFKFQLSVVAENDVVEEMLSAENVVFEKLVGQPVLVEMRVRGRTRFFHGICNRFQQGEQDADFTYYNLDIVPELWLLTQRARSRIFQGLTVPAILEMVLKGARLPSEKQDPEGPVLNYRCQWNKLGDFKKRDYCVQYRETDFNFLSRLMEEEGIHYYFRHSEQGHELCVTDFPVHPGVLDEVPNPPKIYCGDSLASYRNVNEEIVYNWQKVQELRSGKYTLRDHSFELSKPTLQVAKTGPPERQVGVVKHALKLVNNDKRLEVYDYPGEFAQRFDGVDSLGKSRIEPLNSALLDDGNRTVSIRTQEVIATAVVARGQSNCPHLAAGHQFVREAVDKRMESILKNDGTYLLLGVSHSAQMTGAYRSGGGKGFDYRNSFTCVPTSSYAFRPPRNTLRPFVQGPQTAIVVGQKADEICTDRYGRVKVKFHWDRDERSDADSSCWVRVSQVWAGNRWGASFWPRVGQEVVVGFLEGDPDQPIILGSVYNYNQMPPYVSDDDKLPGPDSKHKNDNHICGIKSNSTLGGHGYNEWRFDDAEGKEQFFLHAQNSMDVNVNGSHMQSVGGSGHLTVGGERNGETHGDLLEKVFHDKHVHVKGEEVRHIEKQKYEAVDGVVCQTYGSSHRHKISDSHWLSAETVYIDAKTELQLQVGGNFIKISAAGISVFGTMVMLNEPGDMPSVPLEPLDPTKQTKDPSEADSGVSGSKSAPSS
jgi:type VI secretion system secreted protein VgrG